MSPVHIKIRLTEPDKVTGKRSKRYLVYYRGGGRNFKMRYAGSFTLKQDAQTRRDLLAGELAAGRDPRILLEQLKQPPAPAPGLEERWDAFIERRIDVNQTTRDSYAQSRDKFVPLLGATTDPHRVTLDAIQQAVNAVMEELAPASVRQYVGTLRQVLDDCGVEPNPARSPRLRLPADVKEEVSPPSTSEWFAVRDRLKRKHLLMARLMEATALRIGEARSLTYGDVDFADGKLRISRARTKGRTRGQRWLPVPRVLLDEVAGLVPVEDRRRDRLVFPQVSEGGLRDDIAAACTLAGVPYFTPHALRHRRISLWFAHGLDQIQVKTWAGHAQASMSSDTYGHVLIDSAADEWRTFWLDAYRASRGVPGEAPVRHETPGEAL